MSIKIEKSAIQRLLEYTDESFLEDIDNISDLIVRGVMVDMSDEEADNNLRAKIILENHFNLRLIRDVLSEIFKANKDYGKN
ncbi:hypothetical protein TRIP_D440225 [uncultured Paludibacter sp.]|uniref:Uncharacterized protein n=1 Tax=uncultured Paludibacter sp. TaxID=497635 RepID=A0A653AJG0_9BACT|nr:hypothetical protein TRIP_D440225 [uncultured Paludibacter sp.]